MRLIDELYKKHKTKLIGIISLLLLGGISLILSIPSDDLMLKFGDIYILNESWTVEETSGEIYIVDLPFYTDAQKGEMVHISKVLSEDFNHERTIRIRSSMQDIQIKLNGDMIFDNTGYKQESPPYMPVASAWYLVDIPEYSEGHILDIFIVTDISIMSGRLNEIYYGNSSDLIGEVFTRNLIGIFVILFILSVAIYALIISLIVNLKIKRIIYLSCFSFSISLWMIAEMDFIQLLVSNHYLVGATSYIMLPVATIMFVLYTNEAVLNSYSKILKSFALVMSLYLATIIMLQLFTSIEFIEIMPVFVLLLSLTIITIIVLLIIEIINKKKAAAKYLAFIFVIFIAQILETLMYLVGEFNNVSSLSSLGIMLFLLLIVVDTIKYFNEVVQKEAESKYLRVVAYVDPLTQGLNRAAFERDIDIRLTKQLNQRFRLTIFDMNKLKNINDVYGHEVGDEAIKTFYEILMNTFNKHAFSYRVGGDEFMVISDNISEDVHTSRIKNLKTKLKQYNKNVDYTLDVAYGSGIYKFENDFGLFKHHIDMKMYADKNQTHQ